MEFVKNLVARARFPEESWAFICELAAKAAADSRCEVLAKKMLDKDYTDITADIIEPLKAISAEHGVHEYSFVFSFFVYASEGLLDKYKQIGVAEENFWFFTDDLRCKLHECRDNYGIWGTSSMAWHVPFYNCQDRYALGRFQYDYTTFSVTSYTKKGITIKKGDPCIRFHIPSSGPLTRELRYDSYRRAYEFNRERYADLYKGAVPITCASWLLYPQHTAFLAPNSNLIDFIHDFDFTVCNGESETFGNFWRVFTRAYEGKPASELPTDTSMRRAYAKRIAEGGLHGGGYGAMFYDANGPIR